MGPGELEEEDPASLKTRAFFGLPVPDPQREELARFIAVCAQAAPDFRWVPRENLHLTVRFIGSVNRTIVEAVADALVARPPRAFDIDLGDLGTFGRGHAAGVVWLGLRAGAEEAVALASQVEAECLRAGLPGEARPFQPHLTLARARARGGARLQDLPSTPRLKPWPADQLVLYSSRLTKTGATYEALRTIPLK